VFAELIKGDITMNTNEEGKDIKIPIKALVERSVIKNKAFYEEDEFNLLRKYFIACLNLGYLKPNDLSGMIDKFTSKIKNISLDFNYINKLDCYKVVDSKLYIDGRQKFENCEFYEKNFYKAVTEVIFACDDEHIGISNALTNITAEKIYNMDTNGSRIVMPKTVTETIGDEEIQIRAGFANYNLIISCLKQLFISQKINENKVIQEMFFKGYTELYKDIFSGENEFFIEILDKLCIMYINRMINHKTHKKEKELLDKYQIMVNDNFNEMNQEWFAFLALCTTDELRQKCMGKFDIDA